MRGSRWNDAAGTRGSRLTGRALAVEAQRRTCRVPAMANRLPSYPANLDTPCHLARFD